MVFIVVSIMALFMTSVDRYIVQRWKVMYGMLGGKHLHNLVNTEICLCIVCTLVVRYGIIHKGVFVHY